MRSSFLVLTIAGCVPGACPGGWLRHGDFCYFFGTNDLNWISARDACSAKGGYLAEPKTKVESDYLEAYARQHPKAYYGYWLGGTDKAFEGHWIWAHSNEPFTSTYTDWRIGEPDNAYSGEDCLHLFANTHWNDLECELRMNYICEQKLSPISTGPILPPIHFG